MSSNYQGSQDSDNEESQLHVPVPSTHEEMMNLLRDLTSRLRQQTETIFGGDPEEMLEVREGLKICVERMAASMLAFEHASSRVAEDKDTLSGLVVEIQKLLTFRDDLNNMRSTHAGIEDVVKLINELPNNAGIATALEKHKEENKTMVIDALQKHGDDLAARVSNIINNAALEKLLSKQESDEKSALATVVGKQMGDHLNYKISDIITDQFKKADLVSVINNSMSENLKTNGEAVKKQQSEQKTDLSNLITKTNANIILAIQEAIVEQFQAQGPDKMSIVAATLDDYLNSEKGQSTFQMLTKRVLKEYDSEQKNIVTDVISAAFKSYNPDHSPAMQKAVTQSLNDHDSEREAALESMITQSLDDSLTAFADRQNAAHAEVLKKTESEQETVVKYVVNDVVNKALESYKLDIKRSVDGALKDHNPVFKRIVGEALKDHDSTINEVVGEFLKNHEPQQEAMVNKALGSYKLATDITIAQALKDHETQQKAMVGKTIAEALENHKEAMRTVILEALKAHDDNQKSAQQTMVNNAVAEALKIREDVIISALNNQSDRSENDMRSLLENVIPNMFEQQLDAIHHLFDSTVMVVINQHASAIQALDAKVMDAIKILDAINKQHPLPKNVVEGSVEKQSQEMDAERLDLGKQDTSETG